MSAFTINQGLAKGTRATQEPLHAQAHACIVHVLRTHEHACAQKRGCQFSVEPDQSLVTPQGSLWIRASRPLIIRFAHAASQVLPSSAWLTAACRGVGLGVVGACVWRGGSRPLSRSRGKNGKASLFFPGSSTRPRLRDGRLEKRSFFLPTPASRDVNRHALVRCASSTARDSRVCFLPSLPSKFEL